MLIALKFQKPPDNISAEALFKKLEDKLKEITSSAPRELVGKALFVGELSPAQWEKLDKLQEDMNVEYKMRRDMLLKRLDVTVQSFLVMAFFVAQIFTVSHDCRLSKSLFFFTVV